MMNILFFLLAFGTFSDIGCASTAQPVQLAPGERGNWVKKRAWIKEAQLANEQIQKDAQAVKKSRTQFFSEFEKIDKKVNDFYGAKGFGRGKLGTLIADLKADAQAEKDRRIAQARKRSESDDAPINFYDVQIEAIEQDVKRLDRDFEQFNLDMKSIAELDTSITDRLKAVDKQIKDASDVAVQSTKKLNEMWWMVDDQKACDAYYVIQGFGDKVASIKKYLDETLFADFKNVIATIEKQIEQVNKQVEALEQRGLVVSHRTLRLSKKEKPDVLETVTQETAEAAEEAPVKRRRKPIKKEKSWTELVMEFPRLVMSSLSQWLWAPIDWVMGFWQKPAPAVRARRRRPQPQLEEDHLQDETGDSAKKEASAPNDAPAPVTSPVSTALVPSAPPSIAAPATPSVAAK